MTCQLASSGISIRVSFDANVINSQQVQSLVAQFEEVLLQLTAQNAAQVKVKDVSTMSEKELSRIWAWNSTVPETVHARMHDLIGDVVRSSPDAEAVSACILLIVYIQWFRLSTLSSTWHDCVSGV